MRNILFYVLTVLGGYLLGCSSMAYYVSRWKKVNLSTNGSRNLGASNTTILLGWRMGILVALHDIFKGAAAVLLAKWLATNPKLLILDDPTRGIDVGAKQEIYNLMNELAAQGKGILMVSSDMPELLGMCDRIVVISEGRQTGIVDKEDFSQETILSLASISAVKDA